MRKLEARAPYGERMRVVGARRAVPRKARRSHQLRAAKGSSRLETDRAASRGGEDSTHGQKHSFRQAERARDRRG